MDKKAKKILFDYFWSSSGWKPEASRKVSAEDFQYAKECGLMYEPLQITHATLMQRAGSAYRALTAERVASEFIASLSSRRLDLRSAISSYALLMHLPAHDQMPSKISSVTCAVCGVFIGQSDTPIDINVLSFERLKWGGVRHDQILYATLDLEWLALSPLTKPTEQDALLLSGILDVIRKLPPQISAAALESHLKIIPSNKQEREALVSILGIIGILETPEHRGYLSGFRKYSDRVLPDRRFVDMSYPACWWKSNEHLNESAVGFWFGSVLNGPNNSLQARWP